MHSSPGAGSAPVSVWLSLNTRTHKRNIYRIVGSKGRDMKAYHSYIGEVYTCHLSCNQNQQHSTYSEWLTRLQPFVLLLRLFIDLNLNIFLRKHKNTRLLFLNLLNHHVFVKKKNTVFCFTFAARPKLSLWTDHII